MNHHTILKVAGSLIFLSALISLLITACQSVSTESTNQIDEISVGTSRLVTQVPYVFEPHIAVDPTNPNHLAAIVISVSAYDFSEQDTSKLVLYTSTDGGVTWKEQVPFERAVFSGDGVVGFSPDGTLHAVGLTETGSILSVHGNSEEKMTLSNTSAVTSMPGNDKPWLTIDPHDGTLYVSYTGPTSIQYADNATLLTQSADGGRNWTKPVAVGPGVPLSDNTSEQAVPPFGAQVMIGKDNNLAVAWIWSPKPEDVPAGLWVAISSDKGKTFSAPRQIAETWSIISTTFYEGNYYIFYRKGTEQLQELVVAISNDGGATWKTSLVSGKVPLYFDLDKAPGVNVAPNGTIDVMFYAPGEGAPQCIDVAAYRKRREQSWIDQCTYDVYYTVSWDGGLTFHDPVKLNLTPIVGSRFVRTFGSSRPGEYMGMASTNEYAYPIWIDTHGIQGTQAYTVQIER